MGGLIRALSPKMAMPIPMYVLMSYGLSGQLEKVAKAPEIIMPEQNPKKMA
jgi:hypothetical protein